MLLISFSYKFAEASQNLILPKEKKTHVNYENMKYNFREGRPVSLSARFD
jgi:hypothetical protein